MPRVNNLREKNDVIRLGKDIIKRMESFEESVQELKMLKDSLAEMNDQIAEQESVNNARLKQLKQDLKENSMKVLVDSASELGKVVLNRDEVVEYQTEIKNYKTEIARMKESMKNEIKAQVDEQLQRQLKILELQNENQLTSYVASEKAYKSEIANLKETVNRMSEELESQKQLTADVARIGRERVGGNNNNNNNNNN